MDMDECLPLVYKNKLSFSVDLAKIPSLELEVSAQQGGSQNVWAFWERAGWENV